jgi:4'-phosphopantetheinyl transferase
MTAAGARPLAGIEIWLADLEVLAAPLAAADARYHLLAPSERGWPSEPPPETRRWRRLSRVALRVVLARRGIEAARGAELVIDASGKPGLPGGAPAFSVSHAGSLTLIAVAPRGPIGIDLERSRTVQLSPRRQSMIEAAGRALASAPPGASFLSAWTCLEAFAKARGCGIGVLLGELGITAAGTRSVTDADVAVRAKDLLRSAGLAVAPLAMPDGAWAAVSGPTELLGQPLYVEPLGFSEGDLLISAAQ